MYCKLRSHSGTLMYCHSGTLVYCNLMSHSGTLVYCNLQSHYGTLMSMSHSGTLVYFLMSHSGTLMYCKLRSLAHLVYSLLCKTPDNVRWMTFMKVCVGRPRLGACASTSCASTTFEVSFSGRWKKEKMGQSSCEEAKPETVEGELKQWMKTEMKKELMKRRGC